MGDPTSLRHVHRQRELSTADATLAVHRGTRSQHVRGEDNLAVGYQRGGQVLYCAGVVQAGQE